MVLKAFVGGAEGECENIKTLLLMIRISSCFNFFGIRCCLYRIILQIFIQNINSEVTLHLTGEETIVNITAAMSQRLFG